MDYNYTRSYHGRVQLVVFDWAGTTVDFGCQAPIVAFAEGFRQKGIEISMAQAREPMGREKRAHIRAITEMDEVARAWEAQYGRPVSGEDIDEMFDDFVPLLLRILPDHSQLIPGVSEAIASLREQGIRIGASTGYFREAADTVAAAAAVQGYRPDVAISSSEVAVGRPAPWLIYRIMEELNIHPAAAVVNVGDTVVDVESGLNAGVWSIGVAATGNETGLSAEEFARTPTAERQALVAAAREKLLRAGAHQVIDTMEELPGVIECINGQLGRGCSP
ncbi:phosphonoacetaldehyde hydrolase [Desulfogranum mediterraneum]|uniref:phosphonoacetaldehyde hydrolase n=1 Tax=Desulfogranum mediterraneum TaxID=160661 RepID=UPI0004285A52|nr:phosphonoacetaldehyde hydrolase [Desulfogranum mediterraneum]